MKCLRCGYCCFTHSVIILKPGINSFPRSQEKANEVLILKESNVWCPRLHFEGDTAVCDLHDKPCYKKTPCFSHGQIERSKDSECRLGAHVKSSPEMKKLLEQKKKLVVRVA